MFKALLQAHRGLFGGMGPLAQADLHTKQFESSFADALRAIQSEHPSVSIGSYPFVRRGNDGHFCVRLTVEGCAQGDVDAVVARLRQEIAIED